MNLTSQDAETPLVPLSKLKLFTICEDKASLKDDKWTNEEYVSAASFSAVEKAFPNATKIELVQSRIKILR